MGKEKNDVNKRIKMEIEMFQNKADAISLEKDESECNNII